MIREKVLKKFRWKEVNQYVCIYLDIIDITFLNKHYCSKTDKQLAIKIKKILNSISKNSTVFHSENKFIIMVKIDNSNYCDFSYRTAYQKELAYLMLYKLTNKDITESKHETHYKLEFAFGIAANNEQDTINSFEKILIYAEHAKKEAFIENEYYKIVDDVLISYKEEEMDFINNIGEALLSKEFIPYFQPIINCNTKKVVGCESLVRWRKDKYRIIPPSKFLDAASEKGLIKSIDMLIIRESLNSYVNWINEGLIDNDFKLTLNISSDTLNTLDINYLTNLVKIKEINPSVIEFDLLERDLGTYKISYKIKALRHAGFRVAVDAFKSGNVSIIPLIDTDFDTIKVDEILLPKAEVSNKHSVIYKTILEMANNLNTKIIAKGIQSKIHLDFCMTLNIETVQGYYFSEALCFDKFSIFLNKYKDDVLM